MRDTCFCLRNAVFSIPLPLWLPYVSPSATGCYMATERGTQSAADFSTQLRNLLQQQFAPVHPNTVWCPDITYIWTQQGFVYLTCIMDLFSRKIIAWTLSRSLAVTAVVSTIQKALAIRPCKPQIIHSDRGSQFVSQAYIQATQGIQRSYSRKAYPYDNACIESFHALLKR